MMKRAVVWVALLAIASSVVVSATTEDVLSNPFMPAMLETSSKVAMEAKSVASSQMVQKQQPTQKIARKLQARSGYEMPQVPAVEASAPAVPSLIEVSSKVADAAAVSTQSATTAKSQSKTVATAKDASHSQADVKSESLASSTLEAQVRAEVEMELQKELAAIKNEARSIGVSNPVLLEESAKAQTQAQVYELAKQREEMFLHPAESHVKVLVDTHDPLMEKKPMNVGSSVFARYKQYHHIEDPQQSSLIEVKPTPEIKMVPTIPEPIRFQAVSEMISTDANLDATATATASTITSIATKAATKLSSKAKKAALLAQAAEADRIANEKLRQREEKELAASIDSMKTENFLEISEKDFTHSPVAVSASAPSKSSSLEDQQRKLSEMLHAQQAVEQRQALVNEAAELRFKQRSSPRNIMQHQPIHSLRRKVQKQFDIVNDVLGRAPANLNVLSGTAKSFLSGPTSFIEQDASPAAGFGYSSPMQAPSGGDGLAFNTIPQQQQQQRQQQQQNVDGAQGMFPAPSVFLEAKSHSQSSTGSQAGSQSKSTSQSQSKVSSKSNVGARVGEDPEGRYRMSLGSMEVNNGYDAWMSPNSLQAQATENLFPGSIENKNPPMADPAIFQKLETERLVAGSVFGASTGLVNAPKEEADEVFIPSAFPPPLAPSEQPLNDRVGDYNRMAFLQTADPHPVASVSAQGVSAPAPQPEQGYVTNLVPQPSSGLIRQQEIREMKEIMLPRPNVSQYRMFQASMNQVRRHPWSQEQQDNQLQPNFSDMTFQTMNVEDLMRSSPVNPAADPRLMPVQFMSQTPYFPSATASGDNFPPAPIEQPVNPALSMAFAPQIGAGGPQAGGGNDATPGGSFLSQDAFYQKQAAAHDERLALSGLPPAGGDSQEAAFLEQNNAQEGQSFLNFMQKLH